MTSIPHDSIPHDRALDSSGALLRQGYRFIGNRCRQLSTDVFWTRLGLQRTLCMRGEEAARTFYSWPLTRRGGLPLPMVSLLQDRGSVQGLDGEAHAHRKEMFLSLLGGDAPAALADVVARHWDRAVPAWEAAGEVVLLDAVEAVLTAAVCEWSGIALDEQAVAARSRELAAMIDGAGTLGPRNWRGQLLRQQTERWAAELIERVRDGSESPGAETVVATIAHHRDLGGGLLEPRVAAVELINILRATVAVSRFVLYAALSLNADPAVARFLRDGDEEDLHSFALEVRRFYPFFPMVAGRLTEDLEFKQERVPKGTRVALDLFGTDHDGRLWPHPERFEPGRFRSWEGNPFTLIPQGGGEPRHGHRCPGEWVTIEVLETCVSKLLELSYSVPQQNLRMSLARIPPQPPSRLRLREVRRIST